jgi:hypothetical protein
LAAASPDQLQETSVVCTAVLKSSTASFQIRYRLEEASMSPFGSNLPKKEINRLQQVVADQQTQIDEQNGALWNLSQENTALKLAKAAPATPPASFTEVTVALRGFLPSVTAAPGYEELRVAADSKAFAKAIFSLLQTARFVGRREAQAPGIED